MEQRRYRVAVIGVAHMHVNKLMRRFAELPNVDMIAIADTAPPEPNRTSPSTRAHTMSVATSEIGVGRVYPEYRELLEREHPDIVLLCPELARVGEIGEVVAQHGAHIVTEKPMTASLAEGQRLLRAVEAAKVHLMVNWPSAWSAPIRRMKQLIEDGRIGTLLQFHGRWGSGGPFAAGAAHPGVRERVSELTDAEKGATWWYDAASGGGAYLDYCCYGAALARWFFDEQPVTALGVRANLASHYGTADDNGILILQFPRDRLATIEGTWSCVDLGALHGPVAYGSTATLSLDGERVRVTGPNHASAFEDGIALPADRANLASAFLRHVETGEPLQPLLDARFNLEVMAALDAGIRSAERGER
ncbi:MAG: Gfo/Idh/MocA family oxidoreductase, partial [Chloroflexi bacterium]|nr:Gfo/Idh/MocA family oxidoreductase [Chloroflexota bacterium]